MTLYDPITSRWFSAICTPAAHSQNEDVAAPGSYISEWCCVNQSNTAVIVSSGAAAGTDPVERFNLPGGASLSFVNAPVYYITIHEELGNTLSGDVYITGTVRLLNSGFINTVATWISKVIGVH